MGPRRLCSNARGLAIGSNASHAKGGERMSLGPNWTTRGRTCPRRSTRLAPRRLCTPRRLEVARPYVLDGTFALAPVPSGASRSRPAWAAPPPRLALPGQGDALRQPCAGDGMRAQLCVEGAEPASQALDSSLRRRANLNTCLVQPRRGCTSVWQSSQTTRPTAGSARHPQAEKRRKIRS